MGRRNHGPVAKYMAASKAGSVSRAVSRVSGSEMMGVFGRVQ